MPRYEHDNWGDITNTIFAKGVITEVYPEDDTADVTVEGYQNGTEIPIFYHCSDDAEERSNGAIEGGSAAFSIDDEVIVMCTVSGVPVRIIGFVDGIRNCHWEPWGETLCANHNWYVHLFDGATSKYELCSEIMGGISIDGTTVEYYELLDGAFYGEATYTSILVSSQRVIGCLRWLGDEPEELLVGYTSCIFKMSVVESIPSDLTYMRLRFYDNDGTYVTEYVHDNEMDDLIEIDISSLPEIYRIEISPVIYSVLGVPSKITFSIDYIHLA